MSYIHTYIHEMSVSPSETPFRPPSLSGRKILVSHVSALVKKNLLNPIIGLAACICMCVWWIAIVGEEEEGY